MFSESIKKFNIFLCVTDIYLMFVYLLIAKRWRGRRNYYWKAKDTTKKWYQWGQWRAGRTRACLWCKTCYHDLCPCYSVYGCRRGNYQLCYILYQERWILVRILFKKKKIIICKTYSFFSNSMKIIYHDIFHN